MTQYQGCVAGRFLEQFDAGNFAIDAGRSSKDDGHFLAHRHHIHSAILEKIVRESFRQLLLLFDLFLFSHRRFNMLICNILHRRSRLL